MSYWYISEEIFPFKTTEYRRYSFILANTLRIIGKRFMLPKPVNNGWNDFSWEHRAQFLLFPLDTKLLITSGFASKSRLD